MEYSVPCEQCKESFLISSAKAGSEQICNCGHRQNMPLLSALRKSNGSAESEPKSEGSTRFGCIAVLLIPTFIALISVFTDFQNLIAWSMLGVAMMQSAQFWLFWIFWREMGFKGLAILVPYLGIVFGIVFAFKRLDVTWIPLMIFLVGFAIVNVSFAIFFSS